MAWRAILGVLLVVGPCLAGDGPLEIPPRFSPAWEQVYQGQYLQALAASQALQKDFPNHPQAYLIAAQAYWGLIYCETGHINAQHVWSVADRKTSRLDKEFFRAVDEALEASRRMRANPQTAALGAFYAGLARGVRGRLYALRQQSLRSASEAKQLRADLSEAIAKDPRLTPDAYLGLGAYNYYADVLSPLLKIIRVFLGIPGGDRQKGLEQLRTASELAALVALEAKFELARIYGIREGRHAESFRLFAELSERYPENAIVALSTAYQAEATGKRTVAIEWAQKAGEAAAHMDAVCRERLGEAAKGAFERLRAGGGREGAGK